MRRSGFCLVVVLAAGGDAWAQGDPKFEYAEPAEDEVGGVEWKAAAQAGLIVTTGNSRTTTGSASVTSSRKEGRSKLALDAGLAYARSRVALANDINGNGTIDSEAEIDERFQTTTDSWIVKARYDYFLTKHNSLYAAATASADEPAGKEFVGGAQVGYSRQLYKTAKHEVVAEIGYDLSYEDPVVGDGEPIHSARGFAGWTGQVQKDTSVEASVEALTNFNELDAPEPAGTDKFEDVRVNGKTKLTTKLWEDLAFGFTFTVKFDNAPSARPPLSIPYAGGFTPLADEVDTRTEVSLIYNFL